MKTASHKPYLLKCSTLAVVAAFSTLFAPPVALAANITKFSSGTDLTSAASWAGGSGPAPTSTDVAVWDTGSLGAGLTLNSGTPSWLGITVNAGASDPINIGSGGLLTLGTSGINLGASTINATLGCDLSLASGYQSWLVASGMTLAINGNLTRAAGATMSFPTTGVTSTSLALTNDSTGIFPAWATVTGTADWAATNGSGNVVTYAGYTSVTGTLAPNAAQNWKNTATVTLSGSGTINSMNVVGGDMAVGANTLTLGSGGLILGSAERWVTGTGGTIQSGLASGKLYIHANTPTFANGFQIQPKIIDGLASTAVTKDGPGQVEMGNGASTFSGGFYLNAGSVYLGASSTGSGGAPTQGPLGTGQVTINGGTLNVWGKNNGTGTTAGYTLANNIYIPAGVVATINNGGQNGVLSGSISGVVPTFLGAGITALQGANSYTGNTLITVGTLGVGNANGANNNLSSGDVIVNTNSTLRVGYSVTSNVNRTYTANNITLAGGNIYADDAWQFLTGNINVTSNSILGSTYNNAGGEQDKGLFLGGLLSGSAGLTVQHSRFNTANSSYITSFVAITNNANTYSGTITINENTTGAQGGVYLGVNGSSALANATINVPGPVVGTSVKFGSSPLVFSSGLGGSATLGALIGSGPVILSGYDEVAHAYTGNIALTVGGNNATTNFAGVLSGGGSLIKAGSGTYTLNGTNTYTGSTTVSAGTLTIGGAGLLGSGNYSSAIINNANLTYDSSAAQILSGPVSGSGTLTVNGTRTLTFGGSQTSSPNNVTVNDGAVLNEILSPAAQLTSTSLTVGNTTGAALGFVANSTSVARMVPGTLTLNGTATINILGGNLVAGSSYPLITYTTLSGAGSYTLGSVPGGVAGNLSTSGNTIYFNVTGVTNTIWTGAVNGTWDINTTPNWTNAAAGNTYLAGSPVQFDDTGTNTTTISNSVATILSPISVLVTNNTVNYCFKTNTIIAGAAALTKAGTANLTNSTPNTYTGPTLINQGQVVVGVASVANVSGALGNNSAVTLANDSTAVLNLNNNATQVGSLAGGGSAGGNVTLGSGTLTVGADNSSTTYAGAVSGTGGLTKIGTGALTVSGTNTATGIYSVNNGTLVVTGSGAINATTNPAGRVLVGTVAGSSGALYQNGASSVVCIGNGGGYGQLGSTAGASGYYNLSAGTLMITNGGELDPGGSSGGAGTFGQFDMSGGTVYVGQTNGTGSTYFLPNRGGSGESSVVNFNGGTFLLNSNMIENTSFAGYEVNWAAGGQTNATTISGSAAFLSPSVSVKLNQNNNVANVCSLNLNGGTFQTLGFTAGRCAGAAVNFNGGTLKAGASANASFMGNVASAYIYAGGATIDDNGTSMGIGLLFQAPSGNGVATIPVLTGGAGYITPPQVIISGPSGGSGATAYATLSGGAVSGIVVTCPGNNYVSPTVTLVGGGYTTAATVGTVTTSANVSGGLTKIGNGTLTLSGNSTYTGPTKVLAGTLVLDVSLGLPSGADLVVSNALLTLNAASGTMNVGNVSLGSTVNLTLNPYAYAISGSGNMTLGNNITNNLNYGTLSFAPTVAPLKVAGTLTKGTNIVINISATGLQPGWVVPLVEADSTAMTTNGFVLGSLPPGIKAVLTNNTANTVDMLVTSAGQLLTWHGTYDSITSATNWDVSNANNTNWVDSSYVPRSYQQYLGNTIGDNVIFGNYGFNLDGTNHVNVAASVVPATVAFYQANAPYLLEGAGSINGSTAVLLSNNVVPIYFNNTNNYTGGTVIQSSTLVITNDAALGNTAGGLAMASGVLQLNGSVSSSRLVTLVTNSTLAVSSGNSASMSGAISGAGSLTKDDLGTLSLSGNSTYSGNTTVSAGTLNIAGTITNNTLVTVGSVASGNAQMNIGGSIYAKSMLVGNAGAAQAVVIQTGGDSVINGGGGDCLSVGNFATAYGYYNAAGGSLTANGIAVGGENNTGTGFDGATTGGNGIMEINGGTINDLGWLVMARGVTAEVGILNMVSGSLTFAGGGLSCNWGTGQTAIVNVMGGTLLSTNTGVNLDRTGTSNMGILNLKGGTVSATAISGIAGVLNFNGGAYKAVGSTAAPFSVNQANVYSGGATIDDGGYTVSSSQPLLAPTGYGVSSVALSDGGSGYIAPPIVTVNGGLGSNATVIASVSAGVITGITVTSPGNNYDVADGAGMYLTFSGGGASAVQPASATISLAANTSGSLTKLGSGVLSLTGANTYTGNTVVGAGTLSLTPSWQPTNSDFVVSNTATLLVTATGGAVTYVHNLTGGTVSTASTTFSFALPTGNPASAVLDCQNLTLNGTNTFKLSGVLTAGTFPVLKYHGTFTGVSALNTNASMPHGYSGVVSNDNATSTIYVTVSGAGGIVWQGYNPNPVYTNVWDINLTTNWLSGLSLSTYFEGDKAVFDDTGSGTVLLSNTVSPSAVIISNNATGYSFSGTGHITGIAGVTKMGSGPATLSLTGNDYTGATVVSNGTLIATGGSALGDSSAVVLANAAGASLAISNTETIGSLAGGGASGGSVSLTGTLTAGGDNTSTTYAGAIGGSGGLTKVGNGTMALGGSDSLPGNVTVNSGALGVTGNGSLTTPRMFVAASSGTTGTLNISGTSTVTNNYSSSGTWWVDYALALGVDNGHTGNLNMSGGNLNVTGNAWVGCWGGTGNWNQTGGTANISGNYWVGAMQDNNTAQPNGAIGTAIISNATVSAGYVIVGTGGAGAGANPTAVATSRVKGDLTVANGGVVTSEGDFQVGRSGEGSTGWGSYGTLNIQNGGIVNVASTVVRWMTMGRYNSIDATVNIKSGGTLNLNAGTDLMINEGNNTGIRVLNVGGLLQGTATGGSYIDMNRNATAGGTTTLNITNGGVVAVDAIIGKANCTLNFDNGTLKATADDPNYIGAGFTVNILPGGAILDTAGHNPTVVGNLLNNGVNEDGGLTKNGNGTLYLNGVNTYTNVTTVNAGFLGGTGTIAGKVNVAGGAGIAPGSGGIGTLTINSNLTLNGLSTNVFEVNGTTPANDKVVLGGAVTYGGVLKIVPTGTFSNGQQFQLFSGAGATNTGNFASVQGAPSGFAFSFTNGILSVASTIATYPTNITAVVNGSNLEITWPATHLGWMIQAETNSLNNGLTNNWVDVSNTASMLGYTNTIDPANPTVFYRLRKP